MPSFYRHPASKKEPVSVENLRSLHLQSIDELRAAAPAWDDLWWRSEPASPLLRAELVAQWVERFKSRGQFHALVVTEGDRWVATLPLVSHRLGWLIPAGRLPSNPWALCGDLLYDSSADGAAMDLLLAAASRLPWQLLWLNEAVPEAPRWQALLRACDRAGVGANYHERFRVGRVEISGPWQRYQKRLPKSHRQGMLRLGRRLACEGDVRFELHLPPETQPIEPWLREAFELENHGWKGRSGTSVIRAPGMFDFYLAQADQLARWGQLATAALRLDGRMVAFVYGYRAKGVFFAQKIGYDPHFAAFSPGQLLFHHLLEQLHNDGETRWLDFIGPINQALSRWRPATYAVGRVVIAPRPTLGRLALTAYKRFWRPLRRWQSAATARLHQPPAAPSLDDSSVLEPAGAGS
jgi:CelD/BcsL family acetyltransferase involved in cellulose biosynthesis